jgi:hypothetical protein
MFGDFKTALHKRSKSIGLRGLSGLVVRQNGESSLMNSVISNQWVGAFLKFEATL